MGFIGNFFGSTLNFITSGAFFTLYGSFLVTKFIFPLWNKSIGDLTGMDWLLS